MATNFPTSLDSYSTHSTADKLDLVGPSLETLLNNLQDALAAVQAKVGINASGVTTSIDYILSAQVAQIGGMALIGVTDSPYTVPVGIGIVMADSATGAISIELPVAPVNNQRVRVKDITGAASTYNISIGADAYNIDGSASAHVISTNYGFVEFTFCLEEEQWFKTS